MTKELEMSDFSHDDVIEKLKKNGYEASIIRMPLLPNMPVRGRSLSAKWKRLRGKTDMYTGGKPKIKISKSAPVTI